MADLGFSNPPPPAGTSPEGTILGHLANGRPIVSNGDGSFSTHRNIVMEFDGRSYIIPTMYGGKRYSDDEAVSIIRKNRFVDPDTGQKLQPYASDQEALDAEQALHDQLEKEAMQQLRSR